jgi:uncharacterized protein (TIGR02246 family)
METKNVTVDQQAVLNAILKMTASFHDKDLNGVMASYEPDAVIVFERDKPVSEPAAIRDGFNRFFAVDPRFEYSGHEVFVTGDLAIHIAPWTMTGKTPDGSKTNQSGLSVAVLRRKADGTWLMVFDNPFGQHLMEVR